MRQKKTIIYLIIILVVFFLARLTVKAAVEADTAKEEKEKLKQEVVDYSVSLFDWQHIDEAQQQLRQALPEGVQFDLKEEMQKMITGQEKITPEGILKDLGKIFFGEMTTFIQFGARFVLLVLLCNLLQTLSSSFKSKNITQIGFFVCYIVILISVVDSFRNMTQLALQMLDHLQKVMLVCAPALLAFMATTGFAVSAGMMAPIIVTTLSLMTYLVKVIIMPCIISVIVLEIVNAMSDTFKVDKLIALFYKGLKGLLKLVAGLSLGLLGMYRLVMPGVDMTVKKAAVKFSSLFIPVVGSAVSGTVDFITQGASLVKNTFSAGAIIWIILLLSVPLIKIFAYVCIYQIAGAMIEPLGDKKMASIAVKLGKGSQFIMSCVGMTALFCICSFIICMTIGFAGV